MSTLEKINERVTLLENANKGSTISPTVWEAFRHFISNKPGLINSIEQHLNYYYFTNDRLMHFVYAMAGVFTGDINANTVNQEASTAKNMQSNAVRADVLTRLISIDKGHRDQACEFVLKSKCGLAKATATSNMLQTGVAEELVSRSNRSRVGVLVIHMYVDPPALNNIFTGEGSAINKMVAVIEAAKQVNAPIFLVWKHDDETLGPEKLRNAVRGYNLVEQFVCLHNSFLNNRDHANQIRQKNLDDIFIMGYDADVCVKGTVFGSEYANPIPNREIEKEWDVFKMQHPDRLGKDKLAIEAFLEKNSAKFQRNENDYAPSLVELVGRVVTSRSLLLNDGGGIGSADWGPLQGTRGITVG